MTRCQACETPLPARKKGQRGRPSVYCSKNCSRLIDYLARFRKMLDEGGVKFSKGAAERMRAEIWLVGNSVRPHIDMAARQRFSDALRNGYGAKGWTQRQLADAAGLKLKRVETILSCKTVVTKSERRALLTAVA